MDEEDRLVERFRQHEIDAGELLRSLAGLRSSEEKGGLIDPTDLAAERYVPTPQAAMTRARRPAESEDAVADRSEQPEVVPDSIVEAREALRRLNRYR